MNRHSDHGNATTETVLLVPIVLLVVMFVVFAGRLSSTDGDIAGAAHDAARAASQASTLNDATDRARATATDTLAGSKVRCDSLDVEVDTTAFERGGRVAVELRCAVSLADLVGLAVPGSSTRTATAVEVIDQYRGLP